MATLRLYRPYAIVCAAEVMARYRTTVKKASTARLIDVAVDVEMASESFPDVRMNAQRHRGGRKRL